MRSTTHRFAQGLPWLALLLFGLFLLRSIWQRVLWEQQAGLPLPESLVNLVLGLLPVALLLFALGLLIKVVEEKYQQDKMSPLVRRLLLWTPRIVCLLFAAFVSLFALDVFGAGYSARETLLALFMHLIPTFLMLLATALAWKWEWVGAFFFIGWAMFYLQAFGGQFDFMTYLIFAGLPFVLGLLFALNWKLRAELHGTPAQQLPTS